MAGQREQTLMAGTKGAKYWVTGTPGMKFFWTVQGGTIVKGANDSAIYINWANVPGIYQLSVYGETPLGCISVVKELNVNLTNSNIPSLDSVVYICEGDSFTYDAGPGYISYEWNDGSKGRFLNVKKEGRVIVAVSDSLGNTNSASSDLIVIPRPKINLGADTFLCTNNDIILDAGNFAKLFDWSTGEKTQIITLKPPTLVKYEVWVVGKDSFGCQTSDTFRIYTCKNKLFSKGIPSAITPNNDGVNDCWEIPDIEKYTKCSIEVYDRWGRMVYYTKNGYNKKWCGLDLSGNILLTDAYFYIIDLNVGKSDPIVGSITILR